MWESEGITPNILNLSTKWSGLVIFTPRLIYPKENTPRPKLHTENKTWLAPKQTWTFWKRVELIAPNGNRTLPQMSSLKLIHYTDSGPSVCHVYHRSIDRLLKLNRRCGKTTLSACKTTHGVTTLKATIWAVTDMEN
jgi:hypothetical protein